MKNTIALCMIVKNEEKYLESCILNVKDLVDEIVIVDTGSVDQTIEIANKYTNKVYHFVWNDNFSSARNFSLSMVKSDWILLLDADEMLLLSEHKKLKEFIDSTTLDGAHLEMHNYIGKTKNENYSIHHPFRLLRNNHEYQFVGEIHEQIVRMDQQTTKDRFAHLDVVVEHFGYLDENVIEKDKRNRNLPILLKQLEKQPNDSFTLFNIGNEYLAQKDLQKAFEYYTQSYNGMDHEKAYTPHLYYRMFICLFETKAYDQAIHLLKEAIIHYPESMDYYFCLGLCYFGKGAFTLAIDAFNKCIEKKVQPVSLTFLNDCTTYRPYVVLGDLYLELHDYDRAIEAFQHALSYPASQNTSLYRLAKLWTKKLGRNSVVKEYVRKYFTSMDYLPNAILYTDLLLNEHIECDEQIKHLLELDETNVDVLFLQSKNYFQKHKLQESKEINNYLLKQETFLSILPNTLYQVIVYECIIRWVLNEELDDLVETITLQFGTDYARVFKAMDELLHDQKKILNEDDSSEVVLEIVMKVLHHVLELREFELFEKLLYVLNDVNSKHVLLRLAKLYIDHNLDKMAVDAIIRSMKELDTIDAESALFLSKALR